MEISWCSEGVPRVALDRFALDRFALDRFALEGEWGADFVLGLFISGLA